MESSVVQNSKYRLLLLLGLAVIIGVTLSGLVAGNIMSHRFGWNEKQAIAILRQLHTLEIVYKSEFGTFSVHKSKLLKGFKPVSLEKQFHLILDHGKLVFEVDI